MSTHAFHTMGTVASITTSTPLPPLVAAGLESVCAAYDRRFSLYRADSEASRLNRRELLLPQASLRMRRTYELATQWRDLTEGAFTPHRPDGVVDLSGVVKALAIRDCGSVLEDAALDDWCVNVGGDVVVSGQDPARRHAWTVGIVDPADRTRLLTQLACDPAHPAVCTSGTSERGEHVWRVGASDDFRQVTVAAEDVVTADVLATAILSGGLPTLNLACQRWDVEVLTVAHDGSLRGTDAFRRRPEAA